MSREPREARLPKAYVREGIRRYVRGLSAAPTAKQKAASFRGGFLFGCRSQGGLMGEVELPLPQLGFRRDSVIISCGA